MTHFSKWEILTDTQLEAILASFILCINESQAKFLREHKIAQNGA